MDAKEAELKGPKFCSVREDRHPPAQTLTSTVQAGGLIGVNQVTSEAKDKLSDAAEIMKDKANKVIDGLKDD